MEEGVCVRSILCDDYPIQLQEDFTRVTRTYPYQIALFSPSSPGAYQLRTPQRCL